jgi:hypothetical protein
MTLRLKIQFIFVEYRDFGETFRGERLQERGENSDKYIFMKSHFEDEERLRKTERDFGKIIL